mgnify:CR=1 FL=1
MRPGPTPRSEGGCDPGDRYDYGGICGATLDRPALTRLLADIEAGTVNVILVYKINRLSRSLRDLAGWSTCSTDTT